MRALGRIAGAVKFLHLQRHPLKHASCSLNAMGPCRPMPTKWYGSIMPIDACPRYGSWQVASVGAPDSWRVASKGSEASKALLVGGAKGMWARVPLHRSTESAMCHRDPIATSAKSRWQAIGKRNRCS